MTELKLFYKRLESKRINRVRLTELVETVRGNFLQFAVFQETRCCMLMELEKYICGYHFFKSTIFY